MLMKNGKSRGSKSDVCPLKYCKSNSSSLIIAALLSFTALGTAAREWKVQAYRKFGKGPI